MSNQQVLSDYVYEMVNTLIGSGVKHAVVSPGSRSTPLAYAFAHVDAIQMHRQVDERAAAFYALGLAKAKKEPVVLLCTSGTAAANYFPAIVEAKYARVPLIVLTADRPHELREVGAPQAIDQPNMFGMHVKWATDLPIPDDFAATLPFVAHHVARAVAISKEAPFGPVHINVPFREPLVIDFKQVNGLGAPAVYNSVVMPNPAAVAQLKAVVHLAKRGIIVVGEMEHVADMESIWAFVRQVKWPILIESLSNMRGCVPADCMQYVISTYDAVLKNETFKAHIAPNVVIRFGAQPVSKFLMQMIASANVERYFVIDESVHFRDSIHTATDVICASIGEWLEVGFSSELDAQYVADWQEAQRIAVHEIEQYTSKHQDEGAYVYELLQYVQGPTDLFASSSMPIRDIDTLYVPSEKDIRIVANRGTNGIDGVLSTALGYSNATPKRETYLLIGDLALLHDSNGFLATRYQECDLTVIVMNNDGGGIFSYLPQSKIVDHYEDLFGTPTHLGFQQLAEMYELDYANVSTTADFREKLAAPKSRPVRLIEVMTNRADNVVAHRALWQAISARLDAWLT